MAKEITVSIKEEFYREIFNHLFPGDGKEAVALALCGSAESDDRGKLIFHRVALVPYDLCKIRESDRVKWSTEYLRELLIEADKKGLSIIKIHSHPTGYPKFSKIDDYSDDELFNIKRSWLGNKYECASLVMLPDGTFFGRLIKGVQKYIPIERIQIVGDNIAFFNHASNKKFTHLDKKNIQAFGEGTVNIFKDLKVAVVGCSGTGSPVIEQLARLGTGRLLLIDPDKVEFKNLNRILNSVHSDALRGEFKVDVFERFVSRLNNGIRVKTFNQNIYDSEEALAELSTCDVIFGCVDSVDGRHLLNLISTYYCIPYFDLGVKLIANGLGGVEKICGTIHYVKPGGSSLLSRGVYSNEDLRASSMYRVNPEEYKKLTEEKYIKNVDVERPAVISVNMQVASTAINEFLCRIHSIRPEAMLNYAITRLCISDGYLQYEAEPDKDAVLEKNVGLGDRKPFVNLPELSFNVNAGLVATI